MLNDFHEAVGIIIDADCELEAIQILLDSHNNKHKAVVHQNAHQAACLQAIRKINASQPSKNKDAIESLSAPDLRFRIR